MKLILFLCALWPATLIAQTDRAIVATDRAATDADDEPPAELAEFFQPPSQFVGQLGDYRSPLVSLAGDKVTSAEQWPTRRREILDTWQKMMGPWPALIDQPRMEVVETVRRGAITQHQVRLEIALGRQSVDGFLLVPDGEGPFPAVLVVYYDAQTGAGLGTPQRDFGWQLVRRGFVTLSIGKPNTGVNLEDPQQIPGRGLPYYGPIGQSLAVQPLSALAYAAANARRTLSGRQDVIADRIGIVGHSFGGKWALMASCLDEQFACAVWSDPGIVFDERDRRKQNASGSVNYWDPWYLGAEPGKALVRDEQYQFRKLPSEGQPRTGAYETLVEQHHDLVELHALMAPRPFLVSGGTADLPERWTALNHTIAVNQLLGVRNRVAMTNRAPHSPTEESNDQVYRFFEWWLKDRK